VNATDGIMASPEEFKTEELALGFIKKFKERFERQGYYFTTRMERIPVCSVALEVKKNG
jgi:hypothetical protein